MSDIAIVLAVYNGGDFLTQQLNSMRRKPLKVLLAQNFVAVR